jgi:hypothetical protein
MLYWHASILAVLWLLLRSYAVRSRQKVMCCLCEGLQDTHIAKTLQQLHVLPAQLLKNSGAATPASPQKPGWPPYTAFVPSAYTPQYALSHHFSTQDCMAK